jgi:hypothetical protein
MWATLSRHAASSPSTCQGFGASQRGKDILCLPDYQRKEGERLRDAGREALNPYHFPPAPS